MTMAIATLAASATASCICFPIKNRNADKLPLVGGRLSALFISSGLPQLLTKSLKGSILNVGVANQIEQK